jgi:hypothetical protein
VNPNYKHDFSSASIKHLIEAEFYQAVGQNLNKIFNSTTIVTGPDFQRHIDNFNQYIGSKKLRICEINPEIYTDIKRGLNKVNQSKVMVENKSIDLYGSAFIDCDLTCTSDLSVIKNTLLKQIDVQSSNHYSKAFIFSVGLRSTESKPLDAHLRPILGLLGAFISKIVIKDSIYNMSHRECKWLKPIAIWGSKGRIIEYKCYSYNAGGGPMLTCLLIYK